MNGQELHMYVCTHVCRTEPSSWKKFVIMNKCSILATFVHFQKIRTVLKIWNDVWTLVGFWRCNVYSPLTVYKCFICIVCIKPWRHCNNGEYSIVCYPHTLRQNDLAFLMTLPYSDKISNNKNGKNVFISNVFIKPRDGCLKQKWYSTRKMLGNSQLWSMQIYNFKRCLVWVFSTLWLYTVSIKTKW
jgi:hypothetical protein